jgi:hypothetical protein
MQAVGRTHCGHTIDKKPYTFLLTFPPNLASPKDSGEKGWIDQKDRLTVCLFSLKNLASAEQDNSMLWTKDRTLFNRRYINLIHTA